MTESPDPLPPKSDLQSDGSPRAWLVVGPIVVQSSATLALGLAMLIVGVVIGYWLRPVLADGVVGAAAGAPAATAAGASDGDGSLGPIAAAEETQAAAQAEALMDAVAGQTRHFRGDPAAPVTLIEYSDFQCPFCGRFAVETLPQILEEYVADGRVRLGYQHFAFLGEESFRAAEAAECAGEQDAFWEYHDWLFANQAGENQGAFAEHNLKQFAADLSLDPTAFADCLASGRYTSLVAAETQAAQQLGVRSTPTFLVNGRPVLGAQPFAVFAQYFDSALGR